MSQFRSYFSKNNTLIEGNRSNNSQNPVTEISYGTLNKQVSRFIFDVDLTGLKNKILNGSINPKRIVKHILHMTNTISYASQYVGKKSYSSTINRASSFDLNLFNINQDWDEGSGYYFIYDETMLCNVVDEASNWFSGRTANLWTNAGAYKNGVNQIIGTERFDSGNENIDIDVTDYINQRIFGTGYTGTTSYTGGTYGLGIKFDDVYEEIETEFREAVAFHAKNTNTFYEPYIETIIDDTIIDDRNYFYLDKDNDLYLYMNIGNNNQNVVVDNVKIYDYNDNLINTLTGNSIINISNGVYKITLNIDSNVYPDAVLFRDEWTVTINNKQMTYKDEFYLISQNKYYSFNNINEINFDNYYFYFYGITESEKIWSGDVRKIKIKAKELYPNQNNNVPLDIEYRVYTTIGKNYELEIIPYTIVNRTNNGYDFDLDTSWLIPQDYKIQIRLRNGNYYENKQTLSFTIVSDGGSLF